MRQEDAHAVKFQRQRRRDRRRVVAVAGDVIKIRPLKGEGQILRVGQMIAQMHHGVWRFFFNCLIRKAEAPVRIRQNKQLHVVHLLRGARIYCL